MKRRETIFLALFAVVPGLFVFAYLKARQPNVPDRHVTIYCALDRLHAQPILKIFADRTGIWVRPKWDTEATKTTGLVAALRAEAGRVRCDVFWNNEVTHTIALGSEKIAVAVETLKASIGESGYLVGDRFSVADLTAASLLYPLAQPSEYPYPFPPEASKAIARVLAPFDGSRAQAWVREIYQRHRGTFCAANG